MRSSWQRWGWSKLLREAARRYGPDGYFWEDNPELPFLPIRRWEIWNEENIVTFADEPDPAAFAKLIRISGRALHRDRPRRQGDPRRLLRAAAADPAQRRLRRLPLALLPGRQREALLRRGRAASLRRPTPGRWGPSSRTCAGSCASTTTRATPIYVTELGWGSRSGPTRWERGLQGQANQLSQAFAMLSANRLRWRVGGVWWFTWTDEGGGCSFCRSAGPADREAQGEAGLVPLQRLDRRRSGHGSAGDLRPGGRRTRSRRGARTSLDRATARGRPDGSPPLGSVDHFEIDRGVTRCLSPFPTFRTPTTRSSRTSTRRRCGSTTTSTTRPTSTKRTPRSRAPSGPTATSRTCSRTSPACPPTSRARSTDRRGRAAIRHVARRRVRLSGDRALARELLSLLAL